MRAQTTHSTLLARLAGKHDSAAWDEFCDRYGQLVRSVALRQGLQPTDADDVLQDVLVALEKSMPGFVYDPSKGRFRAYLRTVAIHAIFARLRQNRRHAPLPDFRGGSEPASESDFDAIWDAEWRHYHLRQAMRTIETEFNEPDRIAFARYAVDGEEARTVARDLGLSVDQVYQAKSRILRRLAALVAQQVREEG